MTCEWSVLEVAVLKEVYVSQQKDLSGLEQESEQLGERIFTTVGLLMQWLVFTKHVQRKDPCPPPKGAKTGT